MPNFEHTVRESLHLLIDMLCLLVLVPFQVVCNFFVISTLLRIIDGQLFHKIVTRVSILALGLHAEVLSTFFGWALVNQVTIS